MGLMFYKMKNIPLSGKQLNGVSYELLFTQLVSYPLNKLKEVIYRYGYIDMCVCVYINI